MKGFPKATSWLVFSSTTLSLTIGTSSWGARIEGDCGVPSEGTSVLAEESPSLARPSSVAAVAAAEDSFRSELLVVCEDDSLERSAVDCEGPELLVISVRCEASDAGSTKSVEPLLGGTVESKTETLE